MLPLTAATSATTAETMPGRSPPWTVSTHGVPAEAGAGCAATSATVTVRDRSMVSEARADSMSALLRLARADEHHREVPAQQGHRRVLEVEPEAGQPAGRLRDDPRAVPADHRDGVDVS